MQLLQKLKIFQPLSYLLVGGLTASIYFGLTFVGLEILGTNYLLSVSIAYCLSVSFHFLANRQYTFSALGGEVFPQTLRYIMLLLLNYSLTFGVVYVCVDRLMLSPYYGVAVSIPLTLVIGFFVAKFWVFEIGGPK